MKNPVFKTRSRSGSHISKKATSYEKSGESVIFTLYHTPIVTITPKSIILNMGGYKTMTTKRRMNQISEEFRLGYNVVDVKGIGWVVEYGGRDYYFSVGKCAFSR